MAANLTKDQCILLAVHYASEANIQALHSFTPTRSDALEPDYILRILLTYLPESVPPPQYQTYIEEVSTRLYLDLARDDGEVDLTPVKDISEEQARKQVRRLKLLELDRPSFPPWAPRDPLVRFLCHRTYRIEEATGSLRLVPQLVEPFLERHDYLRTWYISLVLPLYRAEVEYYPKDESVRATLHGLENLDGQQGVDFFTKKISEPRSEDAPKKETARDIKGLVGPWLYGHTEHKWRKLAHDNTPGERQDDVEWLSNTVRNISLNGVSHEDKTGHDWEHVYQWMVHQSRDDFSSIVDLIENWDGPGDVDLGGFNPGNSDQYLDENTQQKLEKQFAQAAFASCYAVQSDSQQTVLGAHTILARLAELMDFIPPPDLATSVESLPKIEQHAKALEASQTTRDLEPDALLKPEHPLTSPRFPTYMLLQMIVYSAYQFNDLQYPISLAAVTKLVFYATAEEQTAVLRKLLATISQQGARKDEVHWNADRAKLLWLWNWGIDTDDQDGKNGDGPLGKISREDFEKEMLKCFTETSCYDLAIKLYLSNESEERPELLKPEQVEEVVMSKVMESYDGASNGNRNRGGVKKANDILSSFRPHFPNSIRFRQASALLAATHALSFYSLTLQHGVPFQPVSIRVSQDPVGLISKVLEQNPRSYTKLDDLISIGQNLVSAGLTDQEGYIVPPLEASSLEVRREDAARRVTFMAVEAALREDDFETAYSYIVSRLTPSSANIGTASDDDTSWRAAFLAGRFRGPASSSPPSLRRLEQRMELLSLALLLAPVSALNDILAVWRRCEEETTSLQLANQQAEEEFDDYADNRQAVPGNFTIMSEQPDLVLNQKRREMGRMNVTGTGSAGGGGGGGKSEGSGEGEAPMSMFDLTRSAAQAFSKNAFPLRNVARQGSAGSGGAGGEGMESSVDTLGSDGGEGQQGRVRRRDLVANAVSGGLASGLGWVLGATPVQQHQQPKEDSDE